MAANIITKFVLGQFAKRSARKSEGIATLLKASDPVVQSNVKNIEIILKNMGVDINNLKSTDDVLKHMNIHKAMMNQHLRQQFGTLNLDKGIKSLEKKKPWHEGWDPKIVPKETEAQIKARMVKQNKETAERVREKRYKELVKAEEDKVAKDPDYIPDIIDPEDMASGGRIGYAVGQLVKGGKWFLKSLYDTKKQLMQLDMPLSKKQELMKQADDAIKHIEGGGPIPEQIIQHIRKDPKFKSVSQGPRSGDPDLAEMEEVILEYGQKHAQGGRIGMMYGGDPGFAFEYGGSWADWHDQHRDQMPVEQYIKTKLPKHRLPFRELQSGGLAYMLGEPTYMKYGVGGSVGHAPWLKPTGQQKIEGQTETPTPNVASRPDPMKAPRGLPSLAPKNMDPAYMQQQMMQKAMMGRGPGTPGQGPRTMANEGGRMGFEEGHKVPENFLEYLKRKDLHKMLEEHRRWKENYERRKDLGVTQEAAEGGRIGFKLGGIDKGRRAFMKWLAGITGAGVAAGTGLLKFGKAAKVVPKVAETVVTMEKTAGMPTWFPALVNRIIKEGDDVTKTLGTVEREIVHTKKIGAKGAFEGEEITVYRNLDTGNVRVEYGPSRIDAAGKPTYVNQDEVVQLEYRAPEEITSGKHKGHKNKIRILSGRIRT